MRNISERGRAAQAKLCRRRGHDKVLEAEGQHREQRGGEWREMTLEWSFWTNPGVHKL